MPVERVPVERRGLSGPDPAVADVRRAVRAAIADLPDGALVLVACSGGPDSLALAAAAAFERTRPRGPRAPTATGTSASSGMKLTFTSDVNVSFIPEDAEDDGAEDAVAEDAVAEDAAAAGVGGRGEGGVRVGAVVVDHGWHPGSAGVAERAAQGCRALGLSPVEVVQVGLAAGDEPGAGGPEAAARDARYAALDRVADRLGAAAVLLGHTLDDQAETVLLGLARGSGARSLAGMAARRGRYRRPLLALPRATTVAACAAQGLSPWTDPSNADPAYTRARVRAAMEVLGQALGPGLPAALARTADLLAQDADALDGYAAELLAAARRPGTGPADSLDVATLAGAVAAVRHRALLAAIRGAGCPAGSVGRRHVLAVDALVVGWRGQGPVHLPGAVVATRDCGRLALAPAGNRPEPLPADDTRE